MVKKKEDNFLGFRDSKTGEFTLPPSDSELKRLLSIMKEVIFDKYQNRYFL
jgi:hypothetical protein